MITQVTFRRFKQFRELTLDLKPGVSLLAGGNNSGKSSILHGLAVWEFCKTVLEMERGPESLLAGSKKQGLGLGDDEFSPVSVPSLAHLWTNLRTQKTDEADGYTLAIWVKWKTDCKECQLKFGLSLANNRLFVKNLFSNLGRGDRIPRIAYLPPFAGITSKETRLSVPLRRRLIGQGLSGAVLRNVLLDMHERNQEERQRLRSDRPKIKTTDLRDLRKTDPWELLQATLGELFGRGLIVRSFNDLYHSYIQVHCAKGTFDKRFVKHPNYSPRDIMVEGSGFLQWLSVYALALSPDVDVLLLDEPDAHLHCSLQSLLIARLQSLADDLEKQVLIATHSTEILKTSAPERILEVRSGRGSYLSTESQKVGLLAGIGTEYCPKFDAVKRHRRMLIVESERDRDLLRAWARVLKCRWPEKLVVWPSPTTHKERKQLFLQLRQEIPELLCISLRDRDESSYSKTCDTLEVKGEANVPGFKILMWRRHEIENYLILPAAIARAAGLAEEEIVQRLSSRHGLVIPSNFAASCVPGALSEVHGKDIINDMHAQFGCGPVKIAECMRPAEVCDDVRTVIKHINQMFESGDHTGEESSLAAPELLVTR
jgi:hypothetical protein